MSSTTNIRIQLNKGKNIYFFSDAHLGIDTVGGSSREREKKLIRCLDEVAPNAEAIFIVGDLFEFWFEYRQAVPKGFVRIMAKLAAIKEQGIAVYAFTGNHDMWMQHYFERELHIPVFHQPVVLEVNDKQFLVGHGDGLGPGDIPYKLVKKIFRSPICRWVFSWLHPDIGIKIALLWSSGSRTAPETEVYHGDEKERLLLYARRKRKEYPYDYFIFGHRHLPIDKPLPEGGRYLNIGDWMVHFTYIEYDGAQAHIRHYL